MKRLTYLIFVIWMGIFANTNALATWGYGGPYEKPLYDYRKIDPKLKILLIGDAKYLIPVVEEKEDTRSETLNKDGLKEGLTKIYYESGELRKEIMYKDNEKDGLEKSYFKSGKLSHEITYKNSSTHPSASAFFTNRNSC